MNSRNFSERIQYQIVLQNLEKNTGQLKCDNCGTAIKTKSDCHFDHIIPYAKGGKSNLENCQILCSNCNLPKNDKHLEEFLREQQARRFVFGDGILAPLEASNKTPTQEVITEHKNTSHKDLELRIIEFVKQHGNITRADISRKKNNLPSIGEIVKRWGGVKRMKEVLSIKGGIQNWDREKIKSEIENWISNHGDIVQINLTNKNGLPSMHCILRHYPELKSFSEAKEFFGLKRAKGEWTREKAIEAGKAFIQKHGHSLRQYHLGKKYSLPSATSLNRLFGSLRKYQKLIGSEIYGRTIPVTKEDLDRAINEFFGKGIRKIKNRSDFFEKFDYSMSLVSNKFGSVDAFIKEYGIIEEQPKKGNFTKEAVDAVILDYLKNGGSIPKPKELTKSGLPSYALIEKFYDSWREPFIFFSKMLKTISK